MCIHMCNRHIIPHPSVEAIQINSIRIQMRFHDKIFCTEVGMYLLSAAFGLDLVLLIRGT